jgi:hypothetical protein
VNTDQLSQLLRRVGATDGEPIAERLAQVVLDAEQLAYRQLRYPFEHDVDVTLRQAALLISVALYIEGDLGDDRFAADLRHAADLLVADALTPTTSSR